MRPGMARPDAAFTKFCHIDMGNCLHYKLVYSSRIYIVLRKKDPSTSIPCIFLGGEIEPTSHG
jgi:hypothetical protein